uniref:Uncharacterized protein n=1 Tax=Panthera tigris altaica TaxID=74533 RepID=A0A8C9JY21_PANTA
RDPRSTMEGACQLPLCFDREQARKDDETIGKGEVIPQEADFRIRLRYGKNKQNLENDEEAAQASPEPDGGVSIRDSGRTSIRSSQWSFSTISNSTQRSYHACCSWTQHPLIQKNRRVVLASFLLLLLGLGECPCGSPAYLREGAVLPSLRQV